MLDQAIQIAETALAGMKGPDGASYLDHANLSCSIEIDG